MQNYAPVSASDTLADGPAVINQNDQAIMSCNSGTAFPTTNLQVGMLCFRTDQNKLYQLTATTPTWVLLLDLSTGSANASGLMSGGVAWQIATGPGPAWGAAIPRVGSDGGCEIGQYLDFHTVTNDSADNAVRLTAASGALTCSGNFSATGVLLGPGGADVTTPNNGTTGGYRLRANATSGKAFFQVTDSAAGSQWGLWTYTNGAATWSSALTVGAALTASNTLTVAAGTTLNGGLSVPLAGAANAGGIAATFAQGGGTLYIEPSAGAGSYNPTTTAGDTNVVGFTNTSGSGALNLTCWSGNAVGVRMTGAGALTLTGSAGITAQNNVSMPSFTITSDIRLKTDIAPLSDFSYLIDRTNTYEYTKNGQRQWGVIAQEIQAIEPILVTTGSDGMLEVDYNGLFVAVVAEVRRLRERVAALEVALPLGHRS